MCICKPKKNALLFCGSGISYLSGLPKTEELSNEILDGNWHDHTDLSFYKGDKPSLLGDDDNLVLKLQGFLKLIRDDNDRYLREKGRPKSIYEDWYYVCNQIREETNGEILNPTMEDYVSKIQEQSVDLLTKMPHRPYLDIDMQFLASQSCGFIQSVLRGELSTNANPNGLDIVLEICNSKLISKFDIATLNHDTLIENLLSYNNISNYSDGFGEVDGDVRWFSPDESYTRKNKISLFKLHGSVNWYIYRLMNEETGIGEDQFALPINQDHVHCKNGNGQALHNLSIEPKFLTGSYNKILEYNYGMIRRIHRYFDFMLDNHHTIIMSGYGWNDRGINGRLFEWIDSSRHNKIIMLYKNPERLKESKSAMWHRFNELVNGGKLILIGKYLSDTNFEEIFDLL